MLPQRCTGRGRGAVLPAGEERAGLGSVRLQSAVLRRENHCHGGIQWLHLRSGEGPQVR